MTQLSVIGPLNEPNFHSNLWCYPVHTQAWQAYSFCERCFGDLKLIEFCSQLKQQLCVEASSNLSGKTKIICFVKTN